MDQSLGASLTFPQQVGQGICAFRACLPLPLSAVVVVHHRERADSETPTAQGGAQAGNRRR